MALSIDSKVKDLMANAQAAAVIDKYIPGMSTNKQTKMAYGMTLRALCKFPQVGISADKVEDMAREIEALGV